MEMEMLQGVKIIDLSTVIAGPYCTNLLADFGAFVIKIEQPSGGDPFRRLGPYHKKVAIRHASLNRNKKSITLDLRTEKGKEMFFKLIEKADVVVENFKTGTLDKWGISVEKMREHNPKIIITHITGYGQTGPNAHMPGFGTPATAFSGLTYITGHPDRPPVSPSFSMTDDIAGLYACFSTMMALYHRDALHGKGQEIDISFYESLFRMLGSHIADYYSNGIIAERAPIPVSQASPCGIYKTKDNQWAIVVCSTDRTWTYITRAMKREDFQTNPKFVTMADRLQNNQELDDYVRNWVATLDFADLKKILNDEGVPADKVNTIKDCFEDSHFQARENIVTKYYAPVDEEVAMPGIIPKFSETPGQIKWVGPELGEHNAEIYSQWLGLNENDLAALKEEGVI